MIFIAALAIIIFMCSFILQWEDLIGGLWIGTSDERWFCIIKFLLVSNYGFSKYLHIIFFLKGGWRQASMIKLMFIGEDLP